MALKFSMILQAVDRVTGPARRITASVQGITRATSNLAAQSRRAASAADQQTRAYQRGYAVGNRLRSGLDRLGRGFARAGALAKHWAGRAGLGSWGDVAEKAGRATGSLIRKMGGMAATTAKWAAGAATAAGGFAVFDLFKTASQFEQYQIMLENMEGSAAGARKAFAWVTDFAATTPYELSDVMEAFVQLKAYGIDPTSGSLRSLGDAAAGMNKPVMQAVEAMADAITGEYERLKEFGIRASKNGDQVAFTYRKAGKDITRTVKATGSEIEKAVTGIFDDRFAGMMVRQSGTIAGMLSNLKDLWSNFLMMVADAGIFDMVKASVQRLLEKVNELAKNGKLKEWAQNISDRMEKAWSWAQKFVDDGGLDRAAENLKTVASAAVKVAEGIERMYRAAVVFKNFMTQPFFLQRQAFGWFSDKWDAATGPGAAPPTKATVAPRGVPQSEWRKGSPSRYMRPAAPARPSAPVLGAPWPTRKTAANDVRVSGKTVVDIKVQGPASASVRSVQASNQRVPLQVNTGRTMAGAA